VRSPALLPLAVLLATSSPAPAVTITLNPSADATSLRVEAGAPALVATDVDTPTSLTAASQSAAIGGSVAETSYTLSSQSFDFSVDHTRDGAVLLHPTFGLLGSGAASGADIYFSPDTDVGYVLSGWYSAVNPAGSVHFEAFLLDQTLGALFLSFQTSKSTPNETFTLGLLEGDDTNLLFGSLTGTLLAGHEYQFTYRMSMGTGPTADAGATATGFVSLAFVPEPAPAALLGLGLAGLWVQRRRRTPRETPPRSLDRASFR
jgi:hypothetical protein